MGDGRWETGDGRRETGDRRRETLDGRCRGRAVGRYSNPAGSGVALRGITCGILKYRGRCPLNNSIRRSLVLAAALAVACGGATDPFKAKIPGDGIAAIDTAMMMRHIGVLAADSLLGRAPGTLGEEKTIAYVEA